MKTLVIGFSINFQILFLVSHLLSVSRGNFVARSVYNEPVPSSKIKIQKENYIEMCEIGNIVRITLPCPKERNEKYYLYKPDGDIYAIKSNDNQNFNLTTSTKATYSKMKRQRKGRNRMTVGVFRDTSILDDDSNKIFIGPLFDFDHGNWILSKYYINNHDEIVEEFSTISLIIVEDLLQFRQVILNTGDIFKPSFPQAIKNLETCQLISDPMLVDRFYSKDLDIPDRCGYIVKNVSVQDCGLWKIVAVGNIVYTTEIDLIVKLDKGNDYRERDIDFTTKT